MLAGYMRVILRRRESDAAVRSGDLPLLRRPAGRGSARLPAPVFRVQPCQALQTNAAAPWRGRSFIAIPAAVAPDRIAPLKPKPPAKDEAR